MRRLLLGILTLFLAACGAAPNTNDPALDQGLIEAVLKNDPQRVDSLLIAGADPNALDKKGTPVLIMSAIRQEEAIVRSLLENGADPNARRQSDFFSTALMEIAPTNNLKIARLLLQYKAKVNQLDSLGDPAINWAAYHGRLALVDLLIQTGARFDIEGAQGTALDIAVKQWHDDLAEYLISKGAGRPVNSAIAQRAIRAVKEGNEIALQEALQAGANPNQKDEADTPLLVLAASKGRDDLVGVLIDSGANPNALNRVGQTAMTRAAYFGHRAVFEQLLAAGADPELSGERYKINPILSAAIAGQAAVGKRLVEIGVDVDVQDGTNGFTPMMFAVAYGHVDFVKVLVTARANPYIKSKDGTGLYDLLSYSRNSEIKSLLEEYVLKK